MVDFFQRTRRRSNTVDRYGQYILLDAPLGPPDRYRFVATQETRDSLNPWFDYHQLVADGVIEARPIDIGSPFWSVNRWLEFDDNHYNSYVSNGPYAVWRGYRGPQFAFKSNATEITLDTWDMNVAPTNDLQMDAAGTTAISRCAPGSPHSSALTALGEIYRDGLPSAPGVQAVVKKKLSGEYLNFEFGIKPFLSDLKNLNDATLNAHRILSQYYRDSGKVVRRSYRFPTEVQVLEKTVLPYQVPQPTLDSYLYKKSTGSLHRTITLTTERWFSGAFTYYAKAPKDAGKLRDQIEAIKKYNQLYGVIPTPENVWDLAPWSWAADWVSNMGDLMHNVSMFLTDGLVLRYGYIMEQKRHVVEYTNTGTELFGAGPVNAYQRFITETKRRRRATPFGFGLELDGLSARQWAIIAALGMSQSGRLAR